MGWEVRQCRPFLLSCLPDSGTSPQSLCSQVQEERILHQQVKCIITEEKVCMVCKKKIGNR